MITTILGAIGGAIMALCIQSVIQPLRVERRRRKLLRKNHEEYLKYLYRNEVDQKNIALVSGEGSGYAITPLAKILAKTDMLNEELIKDLEKISDKTENGKIVWAQISPNTYQWIKSTENKNWQRIATIHKAKGSSIELTTTNQESKENQKFIYILQIKINDGDNPDIIKNEFAISSREKRNFYDSLKKIYENAERSSDINLAEVVKSLLE